MTPYRYLIPLLLVLSPVLSVGQTFDPDTVPEGFSLSAEVGGRASTGDVAPFWMSNGQGGRRSLAPNTGWITVQSGYRRTFGIHSLSGVVEGVVETGLKPVFRLRQAGIRYELPWIALTAGAMNYKEPLELSPQTSGKMMLSDNAAPIPMLLFQTNGFQAVPFTNGWVKGYLDFSFGRMVEEDHLLRTYPDAGPGDFTFGTLWHHKTLYLRFGKEDSPVPLRLTIGGLHAAMWGGRHYMSEEKNPSSLKDFARVVLGKSGGEDATESDRINVLGNQFGQYFLMLDYTSEIAGTFQVYHHHYFEDKSGVEWSNGPDGLFGLSWKAPTLSWGVSRVTLEYATTLHQSGSMHILNINRPNGQGRGGGADSYYQNGEYRTGATYLSENLGSPLLVGRAYFPYTEPRLRIVHNRIRAFHFGLGGTILPLYGTTYEAKVTFETSYGNVSERLITPAGAVYSYLRVRQPLPWVKGLSVGAEVGADFGTLTPHTFGGALSLKYDL